MFYNDADLCSRECVVTAPKFFIKDHGNVASRTSSLTSNAVPRSREVVASVQYPDVVRGVLELVGDCAALLDLVVREQAHFGRAYSRRERFRKVCETRQFGIPLGFEYVS